MVTEQDVMNALKNCYDPEIPDISVVDLGLIYGVNIQGDKVHVQMTLTFPGCPMHTFIGQEAKDLVQALPGVAEAEVEMVWEPPWDLSRITPEGRRLLGMEG